MDGMSRPIVNGFHDARTSSIQYVVSCPTTKRCAIIDPVLDFDEKSGATASFSADALLAHVAEAGLRIDWILDTHPHADHLSAADYLKKRTRAPTAIGARIVDVQALWKKIYGLDRLACDGSQWDRLFEDGDAIAIGDLDGRIMFTPGHTMASITYVIGDAAFINDTLFMPDTGSARADFPRRQRRAPACLDRAYSRAAGQHAPFYRARLRRGRPRAAVGKHRDRAANAKHPLRDPSKQSGLRRDPRGTRSNTAHAASHPPCTAGQRERGSSPRPRRGRSPPSQVPARRPAGGDMGVTLRQ